MVFLCKMRLYLPLDSLLLLFPLTNKYTDMIVYFKISNTSRANVNFKYIL